MLPELETYVSNEPVLSVIFAVALLDPFLATDMEYVLFVTPSCAVTTTLIFVGLLLIAMACEAVPDVTACPFTVTVAFGSLVVGVTVNEAVDAVTDAV